MSDWQAQSRVHDVPTDRPTGWAGYLVFAAVMLGVVGLFQLMAGFTALLNDEVWAVGPGGLLISVDYTVWGWAHLLLGIVALVTAFLLTRGSPLGRMVGVTIAALSAVVNLAFLAANPVWAVIVIAFDVLVIYAICAHGGELAARR